MCWGKEVMAHFVFGTILVAVLGAPFIAISYAAAAITTTRPWVKTSPNGANNHRSGAGAD